ncbi:MAG: peptide ABC transporter substrate-binding protein [Chloroflexi bacterium]|nr:MAG: peptide ABC transporter substrate-binding protein [Chloroflexota bacterium]
MKRSVVVATVLWLEVAGCTPKPNPQVNQLAVDQTLRVAIPEDIGVFEPLDPDQLFYPPDYSIAQNLFDGLFRMDDQLRVVPDIAAKMPIISADGLTYTIPLRPDARFSNGDPVTATDVMYSWNRAVIAGGPLASFSGDANVFGHIAGYADVERAIGTGNPPPQLAGLSAPDPHTIQIRLSSPVGDYSLTQLTLPPMLIVDQHVIQAGGEQRWWQHSDSLVGTGPFKMVRRVPGSSMVFAPVPNWWGGGAAPLLKAVELDVVPDAIKVLQGYRSGHYDLVGLGDYGPGAAGTKLASELTGDPAHAAEVHRFIYGRTEWLGFNLQSGPFSGVNGRLGRLALSQAIDPVELARAACASGTLCFPATGGLISKGLDGYLGDGSNNVLRFNVRDARANLQEWDPTGSVRNRITYVYIANSLFRDVAKNLQRQWRRNLGIEVTLQGYDPATFIYDRLSGDYALFRASWAADYNSPENWYDDLFLGNGAPSSAPGYDSPQFVTTVTQAENASGAAAQNAYQQADRMLLEQAVIDPLLYYVHTVVMKPYVAGFGANALYDYRWTAIKLLQH